MVLGILSWTTISDQRIRLVTLAILVMFAVKTWVRRKDFMHPDHRGLTTETQRRQERLSGDWRAFEPAAEILSDSEGPHRSKQQWEKRE